MTFEQMKKFFKNVLIFLEGRSVKEGQILVQNLSFSFFPPKIDLVCRKTEASEGFWYQGVEADILLRS